MSKQTQSWAVSSEEARRLLSQPAKKSIEEMRVVGYVSSATREIISRMSIPEDATAQISIIPVLPGTVQAEAETPPLWVALAIFLDRATWVGRMMEMGVRRLIVMHPPQNTKPGVGRLSINLDFREQEEGNPETVWEIVLTFAQGEISCYDRSAKVYEEAMFFGVPLSQLQPKVVPQGKVRGRLTA